ncbi:type II secretion system protein [Neobacillus cucumis]|uniref:type II secretion system protein n=1 Tax=Neobacillus cucumis TaxID=1740721 RepID=UPI0028530005|nr:type II secretion system protein [Neobacillus cucumis]MDR4948752.1 type II secretion system protein [Neobacillus cucumis]
MVQALRAKMKEQKGFTLIELLAVIVILGIIAAIAIPAIGNVINKSKEKAEVQDALLIINAAKLYVADKQPAADILLTIDGTVKKTDSVTAVASLDSYIDRVKDEGFQVKVTQTTATDGTIKYSYSIINHDAVPVVDSTKTTKDAGYVTEKQLSSYKK